MKKVFKVTLHLKDGSNMDYHVAAMDDIEARSKSENALQKEWDGVDGEFPGVAFAEIDFVCELDAG